MKWSRVSHLVSAVLLAGCVITTRGSNVPLEVTAELTVDGQKIMQSWRVPGVPAREDSNIRGRWFTYPAFGTLLIRLPTGEGLWVDANGNSPQVLDIVGATEKRSSSVFYFVNSISNPQIVIDYFNRLTPENCPPNFRILHCDIQIMIKRLPDGPPVIDRDVGGGDGVNFGYPDRLRTATLSNVQPIFFLSLQGRMFKVQGAKDDALLSPLLRGIDRPTALRVDLARLNRFRALAGLQGGQFPNIHLEYLGGNRWAAPSIIPNQIYATDVGYRVPLEAADVVCCGGPTEPVRPRVLPALGGEVQWRGQVITYDLVPFGVAGSIYWDVLFDPADETIVILGKPTVKPIWQLPDELAP